MEPIEINAGAWYLRGLRQDDLIDDRPALSDLGETDPDYVARRDAQWADGSCYTWAVSEPTTGEMIAEVTLDPVARTVHTRARTGYDGAAATAASSVRRFAVEVLGVNARG